MTTMLMDQNTLDDRSLLLSVECGTFGNERKLRDADWNVANIEDETTRQTAKRMTRAKQKRLDSPRLDAIVAFDKITRATVQMITMPSHLRKGVYRVALEGVERVLDYLQGRAAERAVLVEEFAADYYAAIERTRVAMGPLFRAKLYPQTAEAAAAEFSFEWRFIASGVPEALARVSRAAYEAELQAFRENLQKIEETYVVINREAVAGLVGHLAHALAPSADGKRKKLYASTVGNISQFVENFPLRNLAQDSDLAAMVARMDALFGGLDVEVLKSDDALRARIQQQAQGFAAEVNGLVREAKLGQRQIVL
jgi:hypothetical protein